MQIYHSVEHALNNLTADNDKQIIRVGLGPNIHRVYHFNWNDRHQEGVLNFLYHYDRPTS